MTVVIGAVSNGHVWLAGDSYCGDEEISELCVEPKVLRVSSTVGLGLCGDVRAEMLITRAVKDILGSKKRITDEWLKTSFSVLLHKRMRDSGVLQENKGIHRLEDSQYVLAHAGKLYYLDSTLALWTPTTAYVAIGAGRSIAMGALAYAHESGDLDADPEATISRVLDCVMRHSHYVRSPYTLLKV